MTSRQGRAGATRSFELFLALRYLRFHRGGGFLSVITLISVLGFTVGTAALVIALSLMAGFLEDVRDRIRSGSAHLTVLAADREIFGDPAALVEEAERVEGVAVASPVIHTPAMLLVDGSDGPRFAEIQGIVPERHARVVGGEGAPPSSFEPLARGADEDGVAGIVLGRDLALRLGVIEGDRVRAIVPRVTLSPWGVTPRSAVFRVVGTYTSDHFEQDSQRAYVDIDATRRLLRVDGASWLEVRVDDLRRLDDTKRRLREALGTTWYVVDLIEQNQDLLKALNSERLVLFLAIGLIVVVAALNIVSTLVLTVHDKVKEIGTLTAMGARAAAVARIFVFQGAVIGAAGSAAGVLIGGVAAWVLDRYRVLALDPDVYYLTYIPFTVRPVDLLAVGLATLAVALVATVYPALKAAGLDPLEAIRYE